MLKGFASRIKEYHKKLRLDTARVIKERWRERLEKAAKAKDSEAVSKIKKIQKSGNLRAANRRKSIKAAREKKTKAARKKKKLF